MKLLELTLPTPAENLALDEALLDMAEAVPGQGEVLRLWESPEHFVVLGRSSQVAREVNVAACQQRNLSVLRRASGGASVLAGPGCLMYAVVLSYELHPELRMLDRAHQFVLSRVAEALTSLGPTVTLRGTSDLVVEGRKISGNSLRCKRDHFLYHGTLLYDFDLALVGELLRMPPRQPDYRAGRDHLDFLTNLPVEAAPLRRAVARAFDADEPLADWPRELTGRLVADKYSLAMWTFRH